MKREIKSMDIAKFFAAIMIICLHTSPLESISTICDKALIGICRIGVPLFFAMSAYLFFLHEGDRLIQLKKYVFRLCKYWIVYSILGIIILRPPFGINILRTFLFDGYGVMWFFHGCIVAMSIMTALICLNNSEKMKPYIIIIPSMLYICSLMMNTYFSIMPEIIQRFLEKYYYPIFVTARNGFFSGTLYMLIGYVAAKYKQDKKVRDVAIKLIIATILFLVELVITWNVTEKIHGRELFITMPFLVMCILDFIIVMDKKCEKISSTLCFYFRKLSFALYGWQLLYIVIIPGTINSLLRFLLVTIASIITGLILIYLSKSKNIYVNKIAHLFI